MGYGVRGNTAKLMFTPDQFTEAVASLGHGTPGKLRQASRRPGLREAFDVGKTH